jgi:hypothetical protein
MSIENNATEEEQGLHWYALNYRTAAAWHAHEHWLELEKFVQQQIQRSLQQASIKIPTGTMEQEFQAHYRRGLEAGRAEAAKALEFAEYMAKDGEQLIEALNTEDATRGEDYVDTPGQRDAIESRCEALTHLRSGIYEFRKRAEKVKKPC